MSAAAGRMAAVAALAVAAIGVALMLGGGSDGYEVTAEFVNASQLVEGNEVVIGGRGAGSVEKIELGDDNQARITFSVDERFAPIPANTTATIRSYSLSGIANRQLQLTFPRSGEEGGTIPDGGSLSRERTVAEVDLDQLFNTLDEETVADFKKMIQGLEASYEGVGRRANLGYRYGNPFLSTSRRLFSELNSDERALERLLVDGARLSGALAERSEDLAAFVGSTSRATGAVAGERAALAETVRELPDFMRRANTTFVNLRAALDDVDPLVEASIPVARELGPFFAEFREAAADAVPTIRDLDAIVRRDGQDNDLVELTRLQVPLGEAGVGSGSPDCGTDPVDPDELAKPADGDHGQGALGEARCSLRNGLPPLSTFRAYTPELVGWFDGFSHPGTIDANGGLARINTTFNAFSSSTPGFPLVTPEAQLTGEQLEASLATGLDERCPGSGERDPDGSGGVAHPFTDGGALTDGRPGECDPDEVVPGP